MESLLESHTSRTTRVRGNEREARKQEAMLSTVFKSWSCFLTNHAESLQICSASVGTVALQEVLERKQQQQCSFRQQGSVHIGERRIYFPSSS